MKLVIRSFPVLLMGAWLALAVMSMTSFARFSDATHWRTHRAAARRSVR